MDDSYPPHPQRGQHWALFLDIDGTLLEFADNPHDVVVPQALSSLLRQLQRKLNGALAFISGRSLTSIDTLFMPLHLPAAALHGLERRDARGNLHRVDADAQTLNEVRRRVNALAQRVPNTLVEDKGSAIALHWLNAESSQYWLEQQMRMLAEETGYDFLPGRYVYEIKQPGANKGTAVAAFMAETPFAGRQPVFLGDDHTDANALAYVAQAGGIPIQVGDRLDPAGQWRLQHPVAVLYWLQKLNDALA